MNDARALCRKLLCQRTKRKCARVFAVRLPVWATERVLIRIRLCNVIPWFAFFLASLSRAFSLARWCKSRHVNYNLTNERATRASSPFWPAWYSSLFRPSKNAGLGGIHWLPSPPGVGSTARKGYPPPSKQHQHLSKHQHTDTHTHVRTTPSRHPHTT